MEREQLSESKKSQKHYHESFFFSIFVFGQTDFEQKKNNFVFH
jgi:hypothetical protein